MLKLSGVLLFSLLSTSSFALEDDKTASPPRGKRIKTDIPAGGAQEVLKQDQRRKAPGAIPQKRRVGVTGACRDSSGKTYQPSDPGYDYCTTHSNQNENQVQIQTKIKEW